MTIWMATAETRLARSRGLGHQLISTRAAAIVTFAEPLMSTTAASTLKVPVVSE
jgi:hypothetical protein